MTSPHPNAGSGADPDQTDANSLQFIGIRVIAVRRAVLFIAVLCAGLMSGLFLLYARSSVAPPSRP